MAGFATASFYGWLPLYLPELFPTRVRATAQGLCYNSGRIFAMLAALCTGRLIGFFQGDYARACANIGLVYLLGNGPNLAGPPRNARKAAARLTRYQ